ncbi:hypothetical protein DSO57_1023601 [Entomophthora muscae]|uniref:Uncharacterized protein n=1 Tax=Entomophthora muscae TaxID=34485 RepID=A0ACC2SRR5_9FUNG|nr:hypothetical protein DSO57_1023601 [Entomophthora muscae]
MLRQSCKLKLLRSSSFISHQLFYNYSTLKQLPISPSASNLKDVFNLELQAQQKFAAGRFKESLDLIQAYNSKLTSDEFGQISISLPEVQDAIVKLIVENRLQEAIELWAAAKSWGKWTFVRSSQFENIVIRSPVEANSSKYDLINFSSFIHLMTVSLMRKPRKEYEVHQGDPVCEAPYSVAQRFCQDIFLDYTRKLDGSLYPRPLPATFEILIRWLVLQGYFELACQVMYEMQRLKVVPRESLVQHIVEKWTLSSFRVSQELADICNIYSEIALPPKLNTLKALKDFTFDILSKETGVSVTNRSTLSKLLAAISNGYLRLKHPVIAMKLFSLAPAPSQSIVERSYINLLKYYSYNAETADLEQFEQIADRIMNLPVVEPTQEPSRAYKVGYTEKSNAPMLPKLKTPLSQELVHVIVAGYGYNQEIESVAQMLQMIVTGGFPSVCLDDQMMMSIMDGFARHSNVPAFKFLRSFWRKNMALSHPWLPELTMIDTLAINRHLDPLPDILQDLLASAERSHELLAMTTRDPLLHLYGFGRKLYHHVASFSPDVATKITDVLVSHENGTPPRTVGRMDSGL